MFYCKECAEKNGWPWGLSGSYGPCEVCKKTRTCTDVPSTALPLHPDGSITNARTINQSDLMACPFFILVPEHYDKDNKCRCTDPTHTEMKEWGYTWDEKEGRWNASEG